MRHAFAAGGSTTAYAAALGLCLSLGTGCTVNRPQLVTLPSRHSVVSEQLMVLSDMRLDVDHPLIQDLNQLRMQVARELELPLERDRVVVYLFRDETTYHQYMQATYPRLPPRRAYFVGTPRELAVYTFWGERIQEDLRHEFTHGLLHSCHQQVPLWLDEGLAEYFEVAGGGTARLNSDYAQRLANSMQNGWRPDLKRLESIAEFSQMQRTDYQEAWAWMHYMLHSSPDTKQVLLEYLSSLRTDGPSQPISERLAEQVPAFEDRFVSYLSSLSSLHNPAADLAAVRTSSNR